MSKLLLALTRRMRAALCLTIISVGLSAAGTASALNINLTYDPDSTFTGAGLTATDIVKMKAAMDYVVAQFTTRYKDPVNVNINVTAVAGTGTLGQSSTFLAVLTTYAGLRNPVSTDSSSPDDATALSAGGSLPAADPIGGTHHFLLSRAEAKALGVIANDLSTDGTFTFGGGFSYAYDPANRAVAGKIDFIGVAMHEVSEIMGRIGVMGQALDGSPDYMLFDLFHYTGAGARGLNNGTGRSFSINNGTTLLKGFNNAATNGGDLQDWDSSANDTFNAFSNSSVLNVLSAVDVRVMDVIGYDLVPPPLCTELPESFDGVTAPALPTGWAVANAQGAAPFWVTATATPFSAPNYAFVDDPATVSDKYLQTPNIYISSSSARLTFSHSYNLEASGGSFFDGGVLEVSSPNINSGAFTDITNAAVGGSFVSGGYSGTISNSKGSPIATRAAWSGNSGGYVTTVANLGPNVVGQTINLRFRMASDNSVAGGGWSIDNVAVQDFACPLQTAVSRKVHLNGAGAFDIPLPFDAATLLSGLGIECRSSGGTNDFQVIFTFSGSTTFTGASLSTGTGSVTTTSGSGTSTITVNLTGVANAQSAAITLAGVTSASRLGNVVLPVAFLLGDANGDGTTNSGDITLTKNRSGQTVGPTNFRSDFNLDGFLNAGDVTISKNKSGTTLP